MDNYEIAQVNKQFEVVSNTSNESNMDYAYDEQKFDRILYEIVVPVIFCVITVIGILGNLLVILVIACKNKMQSATNLMLLNLAIADLTFVVVCPPFTAYQFATHKWPFGDIACRLMHYLVNVSAYVSVYTLVFIALVRYMTIVHNHSTRLIRSSKCIMLLMIFIWIIMLLVNIPILFAYSAHNIYEYVLNSDVECSVDSVQIGRESFAAFFVFSYVFPLLIIISLSASIYCFMKKQDNNSLSEEIRERRNNRKTQACRLLIIVVVLFALLWLPIHIYLLWIYFFKLEPHSQFLKTLSVVFHSLAYFNSCVNPCVYNFASTDFRNRFEDVVLCRNYYEEDIGLRTPTTRITLVGKPMEKGRENGNTPNLPEDNDEEQLKYMNKGPYYVYLGEDVHHEENDTCL